MLNYLIAAASQSSPTVNINVNETSRGSMFMFALLLDAMTPIMLSLSLKATMATPLSLSLISSIARFSLT